MAGEGGGVGCQGVYTVTAEQLRPSCTTREKWALRVNGAGAVWWGVRRGEGVRGRESQKTPEKAGWSWKADEAGQGRVALAEWQTGLSSPCSERRQHGGKPRNWRQRWDAAARQGALLTAAGERWRQRSCAHSPEAPVSALRAQLSF